MSWLLAALSLLAFFMAVVAGAGAGVVAGVLVAQVAVTLLVGAAIVGAIGRHTRRDSTDDEQIERVDRL